MAASRATTGRPDASHAVTYRARTGADREIPSSFRLTRLRAPGRDLLNDVIHPHACGPGQQGADTAPHPVGRRDQLARLTGLIPVQLGLPAPLTRTKLPLPCCVSIHSAWRSSRSARRTVGLAGHRHSRRPVCDDPPARATCHPRPTHCHQAPGSWDERRRITRVSWGAGGVDGGGGPGGVPVRVGRDRGGGQETRNSLRKLRAENRELRRANEILKAAPIFFAAELDRPQR
jgi:hypothetical protein